MRVLNLLISILLLCFLLAFNLQSGHADSQWKPKSLTNKKDWAYATAKPIERPIAPPPIAGSDNPFTNRGWRDLGDRERNLGRCNSTYNQNIAAPYVNVYEVRKIGNLFSEKYKVKGSIEGVCLAEAGYFEQGRKVEDFKFQTTPAFARYEFEVTVRASKRPEIRVYNSNGERDVHVVNATGSREQW